MRQAPDLDLAAYAGYALWRPILLKRSDASDDLVTHEHCHIWQGQHRAWDLAFKHVTTPYAGNLY